jgi:acyl-[acyl-carrier-protein]-phospholipid O-acyltransferase / long-chain-fatty-acid--[acyl-carrier-protein] ligase
MVPHGKVEHALMDHYEGHGFAVTGVTDERKGEKLVVLHTHPHLDVDALRAALEASGMPNLWIPKRDAFHFVEQLPLLGSGKLDLRKLNKMAAELEQKSVDIRREVSEEEKGGIK